MKTVNDFLTANDEAAARFETSLRPKKKTSGRSNPVLAAKHTRDWRARRKAGQTPMLKPWDYLTLDEVKDMAAQAYKIAAWSLSQDASEGRLPHHQLREAFAESLAEIFKAAVDSHAVLEGGCWCVDSDTPGHRNYPAIWRDFCGEVPPNWRTGYPIYKKVTPAERGNAPGVVINADEGNVDGTNSNR